MITEITDRIGRLGFRETFSQGLSREGLKIYTYYLDEITIAIIETGFTRTSKSTRIIVSFYDNSEQFNLYCNDEKGILDFMEFLTWVVKYCRRRKDNADS